MLIDVFPFFNEFRVLAARMEYLKGLVDVHIAVESDLTYSGMPKRLLLTELRTQLGEANKRLLVVPQYYRGTYDFKNLPKNDADLEAPQHLMERFQRDGALEALQGMPPDAMVMIGDVDEIPSQDAIRAIMDELSCHSAITLSTGELKPYAPTVLVQDHLMYTCQYKVKEPWLGTVMAQNQIVSVLHPSKLRLERDKLRKTEGGGWHLNNFTNPEGLQAKIQSFAHQNLNVPKYNSLEHLKECMEEGRDPFARKAYKLEPATEVRVPDTLRKLDERA